MSLIYVFWKTFVTTFVLGLEKGFVALNTINTYLRLKICVVCGGGLILI